jgi:hypothetical protein
VLLRIARELGVSIADLVDEHPRVLASGPGNDVPAGLRQAATELGLTDDEVARLATIRFRGRQPQSVDRWKLLVNQLKLTEALDRQAGDRRDDE